MIKESVEVFFKTVKEMRKAQKKYFDTRAIGDLTDAKKLEKSVDKQLTEVEPLIALIDEKP